MPMVVKRCVAMCVFRTTAKGDGSQWEGSQWSDDDKSVRSGAEAKSGKSGAAPATKQGAAAAAAVVAGAPLGLGPDLTTGQASALRFLLFSSSPDRLPLPTVRPRQRSHEMPVGALCRCERR